ncbi:MAG: transporter (formate/nitrite transporter family protein) [Sphingopyxis sp.]|nr:MAG: transporter (formate/nitrite transporter family protein) [Sphingopyxis sp.]
MFVNEKSESAADKSDPDDEPNVELSSEEKHQAKDRASIDSNVVHEVVRREGHDELRRPAASLFWSGLAAGIAINTSILGESLLEQALPDTAWRPAISSIGYTLGFLIVILGRLQLFTESTLSAALPVATNPTWENLCRIGRLWGIVLIANLCGSLLITALLSVNAIGFSNHVEAMIELSRKLLDHSPMETLRGGIPAGFLLAAVAWSLPVGRKQEFWIIFFFTYFVGLGGFSHVVAGSGEAWLLWLSGEASLGFALFGFILPALAGNVIGGTLIFALLAHAQVHNEIAENSD